MCLTSGLEVDIMPKSIVLPLAFMWNDAASAVAVSGALGGFALLDRWHLSGISATSHFAPQLLTEESHLGLSFSVQITCALASADNRSVPIGHLKNGFSGDISPLQKEPFNSHAAVDGLQLSLVQIKT